ncbi:MAG: hypothetical protein ACI9UA_005566 [Pseudoalteromonas tetraodonis]|jgi:hypothetical protein
MKLRKLILSLLAASAIPANAALLGHYTFDADTLGVQADGTVLSDGGVVGGSAGGSVSIVAGGPSGGNYASFSPTTDGLEGVAAPHLSAGPGATVGALGITGADNYTMAAFVRFNNQTGDNMIFGGSSGDVLHLGARNAQYHSGHWGDDLNSGATSTEAGAWHHVAFTNTTGGLQEIFLDGVNIASGNAPGTGAYTANVNEILLIGTSRNGGSLNGDIDDVRVYNEVLSGAAIGALAGIPEPSGTALIGLSGLALILRRRRS